MAKFRITGPDGSSYEITAPDNATHEQLMAFVQSQAKPKAREVAPDPTEGMSTTDKVLSGIGSGMADLAYGVGQRLGLVDQATIDEKKRLDLPLLNTTAGSVGTVTGKVAASLPAVLIPGANTVVGAGLIGAGQGLIEPTASGESVLKNTALGAASGVGGLMAGRAIAGAVGGAKALVEPFTESGRQNIAGRMAARFADDPSLLAQAKGGATITGAVPTLAEETGDAGLARLQDALRSVDPTIAGQIDARLAANNAARVNALQAIAGNEGTRAAADATRKAATAELYQRATGANYRVDGVLDELLNRPAVQQASARAKNLAANNGRPFIIPSDAPVIGTSRTVIPATPGRPSVAATTRTFTIPSASVGRDATGMMRATEGPLLARDGAGMVREIPVDLPTGGSTHTVPIPGLPGTPGTAQRSFQNRFDLNSAQGFGLGDLAPKTKPAEITGQGLQDLKMAMDEMLSDPSSGFTGKAGQTIKNLRSRILGWMENANPDFKEARTTYANLSAPLNQQDIAAEILKRGAAATTDLDGVPRLMPNALARALQDPKTLIERATGRSGLGNSLSDVMEPSQLATINAIADEVNRTAAVGRAGNGPGSATAQRMAAQNILRQIVGPTGLPSSWAESAIANTVIGKPFNLIYGGVAEPKIQNELAKLVLDPASAQRALAAATPAEKNALAEALQRYTTNAARQGLTASLVEQP